MEPASAKGDLSARLLTWDDCQALSLRLASSETMECLANGYTPEQALAAGLLFGLSWAVHRDGDGPVGAFGFTTSGVIWSLWGDLTPGESRILFAMSRDWIPYLVRLSGRPQLHNAVHSQNTTALKWLAHTGCFNFDFANPRRNADGSESFAFETFAPRTPDHV